jgi:hypothetical protein
MQYSPKLKRVMEDIKAILKKEDIAGVVVLHNIEGKPAITKESIHVQGFTEYLFHINTSYSAASIENDRFKVKGKAVHYPTKGVRDEKVANAVNMLNHLGIWTSKLAMQAIDMEGMVEKMVEKDKGFDDPGTHTSHSQQNN